MLTSWKLGRAAGIDVYIHPTFLLILFYQLMIGGPYGLTLASVAFGCVVLHEYGHALAARGFGIGTEDITLYPFGGVARLSRMPRSPGAELVIALAGPAVNFAIAIALTLGIILLGGPSTLLAGFLANVVIVNVLLGAFNLIPAFPMDGGRVFRALLSTWIGRIPATRVAAGLGRGLAVPVGLLSVFYGQWPLVLVSAFVYFAGGAELANVLDGDRPSRRDPRNRDDDSWNPPSGYRWIPQGKGAWQLAPIVVPSQNGSRHRWR